MPTPIATLSMPSIHLPTASTAVAAPKELVVSEHITNGKPLRLTNDWLRQQKSKLNTEQSKLLNIAMRALEGKEAVNDIHQNELGGHFNLARTSYGATQIRYQRAELALETLEFLSINDKEGKPLLMLGRQQAPAENASQINEAVYHADEPNILTHSRHDPDAAWQKSLYIVPFFTADGQKAKVVGEYMKGDSLRFEVKNKTGDTYAILKRTHLDNGEQVWMLPKHASISGGAPASLESMPIMGISSNAWNKVNSLDESIVTNIAHQLDNEGVGHVIWGSKPVHLLEELEEEGIWHDMTVLTQGSQLKDNFQLLTISSNSQKPPEEQEGYLVNKENLLRVIDQEKSFFAEKFSVSDMSSSTAILNECVIPHLQNLESSDFNNDQEFLATVLGFGRSNALAVVDTNQAPAYTESINQQIEGWMIARAAEKNIGYPIPKLPPFKKLPSAESQALVNQYLKDSDEIHTNVASLFEQHSNLADEENIELSDAKIFVAALLTALER